MNLKEFIKAWPLLTRQVRSLRIPWVDQMSAEDRDPFKILISCILSLRTQDKTTEEASQRLFRLAQTAGEMSRLSAEKIQKAIYPVGFYRVKAGQGSGRGRLRKYKEGSRHH
jgi:endonuclease-3